MANIESGLFFFQPNNEECNKLESLMAQYNILNKFEKINVNTLKNIPQQITGLPAIVIKGIEYVFIQDEAFKWIDSQKYFYQETNNITKQPIKVKPIVNELDKIGINKKEMSSITDDYTFIEENKDSNMQKTFKEMNDNFNDKIVDEDKINVKEEKITDTEQKDKMNDLLSERANELKKMIAIRNIRSIRR